MMVLSEPGLVGLYLWEVYGPKILECYEELAQSPGSLELEALRLIQDRYQRLKIPAKERSYLGDPALLHLGNIKRGTKSPIYVAIFPDHLELLSKECRDSRLLVGARARWFALGSLAKE